MRLLLSTAALLSVAACGGDGSSDAAPDGERPTASSATPSASSSAAAQAPVDDSRLRFGCGSVELALAALGDDELAADKRSEEAAGYLADANEDLEEVDPPSQASADLRFEVTLVQAAILSGSTIDTSGLNRSYTADCVPLGFEPIPPD